MWSAAVSLWARFVVQYDVDQDLLVEEAKRRRKFQPIVSNNRGSQGPVLGPEVDEQMRGYPPPPPPPGACSPVVVYQ